MRSAAQDLPIREGGSEDAAPADDGRAPAKAAPEDFLARMREIVSDPLNLAIARHPLAGVVDADGFVRLHNGLSVPAEGPQAYYGEFSRILIVNRGVHEPLEEFAFQEAVRRLPEAPAMLELGAYWGHYSMWLKARRPRASVTLVEPDDANRAVGEANFRRNGIEGAFVAASVGHGGFTVDGFLRDGGLERLDLLHADIQGAEIQMLEGAAGALAARRIDRLFVSTHSDRLHAAVVGALAEAGYRIEASSDFGGHSTAYDGVVIAARPGLAPLLDGLAPLGRREIAAAAPAELAAALERALRVGDQARERSV